MPYTFITQGQFVAALQQRLYDSTGQLYPVQECIQYQNEALQAFNAFANFSRFEFIITLSRNVTWYDLTTVTNTIRPLTFTDQQVLNLIQYHFLEPQSSTYPLVWTGSKQFALSDILNAIQQVRDQLLSETNCTITDSLVAATPGRIFLSDNAIQLRRVCWIPVTGFGFTTNCLLSSDIWGQQSFEPGFVQQAPGYPLTYRRSTEPPLSFDVDVQPAVSGQYDVLTVNAGGPLTTASATVLPIPNDWCFVNKYGAMAQLLGRDSLASDPLRAQYAMSRYKHGIAAMQKAPALLAGRINDVPAIIDAVTSADFYDANWQGKAVGAPTAIYYAGLNMLAVSPTPDTNGPYSVTASVLQNMPLPSKDGAFLQIGREDIGPILDHAQHIGMIKVGGAEFAATAPLLQNFLRHCTLYNSKLAALSPFLERIDLRSHEDERENPIFSTVTPETVSNG